jgi:hypothetical protein
MIRILSDNDNLHCVERTKIKGIKNKRSRRIARRRLILLPNELRQLLKIWLLEFRSQVFFPSGLYLNIHGIVKNFAYKDTTFFEIAMANPREIAIFAIKKFTRQPI